jgi:hypothetical protein
VFLRQVQHTMRLGASVDSLQDTDSSQFQEHPLDGAAQILTPSTIDCQQGFNEEP